MLAPVPTRSADVTPSAAPSKKSGKKPPKRATTARAAFAVGAIAASFSVAGCPCLESIVNPSPALQWWLFSNFGASRMCPEMLKTGMALRLQNGQPAIGRFFPNQCSYAVDDNRLGGITRGSIPGSRKAFVTSPRDPSVRVAVREIALKNHYRYNVINDDVAACAARIAGIIEAERYNTARYTVEIPE